LFSFIIGKHKIYIINTLSVLAGDEMPENTVVTAFMDYEIYEKLRHISRKRGKPISSLIKEAIKEFLKKHASQKKEVAA